MDITKLLRPHILHLKPYASARDEYSGTEGVFLDANENPWGSITKEAYNRYPAPHQKHLKEKIAAIKQVAASQIFLGNGSDEAIDLLIRAFCEPKQDHILIMPPTYGMYEVSAHINGIAVQKVPLAADFQINTEEVLETITPHTKVIFICSPNNPTGNLLSVTAIETILANFQGIIVIDEAYIDYRSDASWLTRLEAFPQLVVLQTFSKAWGLAALRLGMAFGSEDLIHILNKIKPPYNINEVTQRLVTEGLVNEAAMRSMVKDTLQLREGLALSLDEIPIVEKVYPSETNFLLVKFKSAATVFQYLLEEKIIVRNRSQVVLCENCLRITVGTPSENKQLLVALEKFSERQDRE